MVNNKDYLQTAKRVIELEIRAIAQLPEQLGTAFNQACATILACTGRTVVMGIGKSSHIGSKIAASLASTGTPAFFVHAGEACHGDLGMIMPNDVVIAISNSGETSEFMTLLPQWGCDHLSTLNLVQSVITVCRYCHLDGCVQNQRE